MITIEGKSVFGGVSIGKLMFYKRNEKVIRRTHVDDVDAEWKRFEEAKNTAIDQLKDLYDKAIEDVGEANAMIFEIHQMMLDDLDYLESIEGIIRTQSVNAEYAVSTTADNFAQMFASMDDAYMQGRAADVKDVSERVLDILCGVSNGTREMTEPCIVAADDLAPSETVQLDKEKVLGFATMYGSSNSHTAILARTMNIPAVIGMGEALNPKYDGEMAIIDGFTGTIYVDPDEETLAKMQEKRAKDLEQKELLNQLKGKENVTKSGQKINVYANIGNVSDLGAVLKNDAGGVGLFRSEFLYLENSTYPTEEQQFAAYKQVVESMAGKKVIIRTLDIGADKQVDYFNLAKEENPALGYRAIRICLTRPEIFKTQLRALYRASVYGNLSIMFPMIISVKEVRKIKEIIERLKQSDGDQKMYRVEDRLHYYVQPVNKGKREAMAVGAHMAKHELLVFVDSDSFLDPYAVRNIVQPFKDKKMGGVSGRTDVANTYTNSLTKMQAVRYYIAFRIMKAAEGYFDAVTCLSGPLSCYRKDLVLKYCDDWLNQKFLGQRATFGDDRSMTNFILRHHRTTYQDTAVCMTIVPKSHKMFLRQQMRWKRSWLRESIIAARYMWKKEPFMALSFYMGLLVPIAAPIIVLYNLIYIPIMHRVFPLTFLVGMLMMALLMSMAQLFLRRSTTWIFGVWFCLYYEAVLLWQMPVAWFTFWKSTWGTRLTPADLAEIEKAKKKQQKKVRREGKKVDEH